jgi:metal-responsive CopG/Arc/MetJ family transcriptional regulator
MVQAIDEAIAGTSQSRADFIRTAIDQRLKSYQEDRSSKRPK